VLPAAFKVLAGLPMHAELMRLYLRHAASSFDKQLHLSQVVGSCEWQLDLGSGQLSFGNQYHWQAQVLGTEAEESNTWLWAWANQASQIPPQVLGAALTLRLLGEHRQIPALTEPQVLLDDFDGHFLAMIGSGICRASAYYRAPYEGGAAYLLIKDDAFPLCSDAPVARIASVFPQAISSLEIPDHKVAFIGYLEFYGLTFDLHFLKKANAERAAVDPG
jgi:hypothetical protein